MANIKAQLSPPSSSSVSLVLVDVVVEQLGDQVDVSQDHATAAVSLEAQLVKRLSV